MIIRCSSRARAAGAVRGPGRGPTGGVRVSTAVSSSCADAACSPRPYQCRPKPSTIAQSAPAATAASTSRSATPPALQPLDVVRHAGHVVAAYSGERVAVARVGGRRLLDHLEHPAVAAVGREVAPVRLEHALLRLGHLVADRERGEHLGDDVVDERAQQRLLVVEPGVDRAVGDACGRGDVGHPGVGVAALLEHRAPRGEQVVARTPTALGERLRPVSRSSRVMRRRPRQQAHRDVDDAGRAGARRGPSPAGRGSSSRRHRDRAGRGSRR